MRLFDGAIGPTQLAQAQANASLNAAQRLKFSMDLSPVEARAGGFARVTGSVPLASSGKLQSKTTIIILVSVMYVIYHIVMIKSLMESHYIADDLTKSAYAKFLSSSASVRKFIVAAISTAVKPSSELL